MDNELVGLLQRMSDNIGLLYDKINKLEDVIDAQADTIKGLTDYVNMLDSRTVHEVRYGI